MENDYEQGEPDGYVCKECMSTFTIRTYNIMSDNGEGDPVCPHCDGEEILPMTVPTEPKVEDLEPMQKFRIVYIATERQDHYYEDDSGDYGRECHTLVGTPQVRFKDVFCKVQSEAIRMVAQEIENIGEANASNPPYDTYSVKMIYDLCTMIPYSEDYFLRVLEEDKREREEE